MAYKPLICNVVNGKLVAARAGIAGRRLVGWAGIDSQSRDLR
jgi:hypothetical protein